MKLEMYGIGVELKKSTEYPIREGRLKFLIRKMSSPNEDVTQEEAPVSLSESLSRFWIK